MAVALSVISESGDHYLSVWDSITPEELELDFRKNMEMYAPICSYQVRASGSSLDQYDEFTVVACKMRDLSWKHDNEEDDQIPW